MFRETFTYTLHSKLGNKCTHAPGYRYVNLPSDTIYLNVETAPLAKTQFTLKLGEAGYLQVNRPGFCRHSAAALG